jgi:hypothetical protein
MLTAYLWLLTNKVSRTAELAEHFRVLQQVGANGLK